MRSLTPAESGVPSEIRTRVTAVKGREKDKEWRQLGRSHYYPAYYLARVFREGWRTTMMLAIGFVGFMAGTVFARYWLFSREIDHYNRSMGRRLE